jgi:NAD(P)-dependent dehydrogenase (short-subunit alcohol dehydrogenase family)
MPESLQGRTVVVTGGTGALGRVVVARLLAEGASPVVTYRSERELGESSFTGDVRTQRVDAGDEAAVRALYRGVPGVWASVHLVGAFTMAPIAETSAADFRKMFEVNAVTCFLCCREAVVAMRLAGSGGGRIVNVAARPAVSPAGGMIAYSASKAAVASLTQSLAEEVKAEGILVNAVLPSVMDTPANRASMPGADYSKWPKVEEVAEAIAFLISPANSLTTGALVPVYGRA